MGSEALLFQRLPGECWCTPVGTCTALVRRPTGIYSVAAQDPNTDLAAVVVRNLSITRSLHVVDTLLLMLHVQEVRNFEWWECSVAAEEVPAQDPGEEEPQQDCFRMSVAQ